MTITMKLCRTMFSNVCLIFSYAELEGKTKICKRQIRSLEREIEMLTTQNTDYITKLETKESNRVSLECQLEEMQASLPARLENERILGRAEMESQATAQVQTMTEECARYRKLYLQEMTTRREMHNTLMELKGNIRVFCRVRPIQDVEKKTDLAKDAAFFNDDDPTTLDLIVGEEDSGRGAQTHHFQFDHVFKPQSTQKEVFDETQALVMSAMDGYNVSIFAYGQTGRFVLKYCLVYFKY